MANWPDSKERYLNEKRFALHLSDYFCFRAVIKFSNGKTVLLKGKEYDGTFDDLLRQEIKVILLDRQCGYNRLNNFISKAPLGQIIAASIYVRIGENNSFIRLVTRYYRGKVLESYDWPDSMERFLALHYSVIGNEVVINDLAANYTVFKASNVFIRR